jgi:LPS sulfotransferase NodH
MKPKRSYFICKTNRTGSQLLCEALRSTGIAGQPNEHLYIGEKSNYHKAYGTRTGEELLAKIVELGSTPNGVLGLCVELPKIEVLAFVRQVKGQDLPFESLPDLLRSLFPDPKYIWLTRRNVVRQAVSWWKACQSEVWHASADEKTPQATRTPEYNYEAIDQLVSEVVMREAAWEEYFSMACVQPLTVVYEDFVAQPRETVAQILEFLEIPYSNPLPDWTPRNVKLADATSEEWVQRYRKEKQRRWETVGW